MILTGINQSTRDDFIKDYALHDLEAVFQQLSWLPLSPDQLREELLGRGRVPNDYDIWNIDKKLAIAFDEINQYAKSIGGQMYNQAEFSKSLRDRQFTKRFYHLCPTLLNMDHFVDPELERPCALWNANMKAARRLLLETLQDIPILEPLSVDVEEDVMAIFGDKTTSVGFGGHGSKADNSGYIFNAVQILRQRIASGENLDDIWIPAAAFHRAQISGYVSEDNHYCENSKTKDRLVMGVDGATVAIEGRYARPLYEQMVDHWFNYSGGDDPDAMRNKIIYSSEHTNYWYQMDFSKFDQSIQSWLIADCFEIIKSFFPQRYHREISWIAHNFIHTRVWLPGCQLVQKHRGIPSGSYFTQIIGSMCNMYMILTYLCSKVDGDIIQKIWTVRNQLSAKPDVICLQALGDDSITFSKVKIDLDDLASYVLKVFGVKVHPDKCVKSSQQPNPHYLKRDWTRIGEWRNPLELVIALCHPEYWRTYDGYGPWHIMYGLFLTYRAAFPRCINEIWILKRMENDGGIEALEKLDVRDLPGPLRGYGDKARIREYLRAKAWLASTLAS